MFMLFNILCFAQQTKFKPRKGEITFISSAVIPDTTYFTNSLKESQTKFVDHLTKKLAIRSDEKIDTASLISLMGENINPNLFCEKAEYKHLYRDSIIESYKIIDGKKPYIFSIIEIKKSKYMDVTVMDEDTSATEPNDFRYIKSFEETIKEFRNEKKTINGYECFKVTSTYRISFNEDEEYLQKLTNDEKCFAVYWVTEKVNSLFHPVCKEKMILERYFPLELSYINPLHKGLILNYKLKSICLSK